jgi:hypothetical protein
MADSFDALYGEKIVDPLASGPPVGAGKKDVDRIVALMKSRAMVWASRADKHLVMVEQSVHERKIGDDPVGFKCTNLVETQVHVDGVLRSVCMVHRAMLDDDPSRVSFGCVGG